MSSCLREDTESIALAAAGDGSCVTTAWIECDCIDENDENACHFA